MTHEAYKAFDRNTSTYWESDDSAGPHTLKYQFDTAQIITKYAVTANANKYPSSWTFEGSQNGSDWTVLDTQSSQSFTALERKEFSISNTISYLYYRINISEVAGTGIPLAYEVRDIDWNLIGYVKAKSTLEPDSDQILPADPPPTFATVIANAGSFVIDVGTSVYLGDLHYQRISTITLNSVVIKTFQIDGYLIEGTYLYTGEWLSGSGSCVYHDEDHYIYRYTIYKYDGTAPFSAPSSVENYLNINGTEIKIADSSLGQGYIDYTGYLLPGFDYRIGIFNNGTDFYYIFSVNWYNDDDQSWWEFFYKKNDNDLIRWTGPISENWEFESNMPLGFQIDGVDAYCWDGSVGIIIS